MRRHDEAGESLKWHFNRALELEILSSTAVNDHSYELSKVTVTDAAAELLEALGWFPASG